MSAKQIYSICQYGVITSDLPKEMVLAFVFKTLANNNNGRMKTEFYKRLRGLVSAFHSMARGCESANHNQLKSNVKLPKLTPCQKVLALYLLQSQDIALLSLHLF